MQADRGAPVRTEWNVIGLVTSWRTSYIVDAARRWSFLMPTDFEVNGLLFNTCSLQKAVFSCRANCIQPSLCKRSIQYNIIWPIAVSDVNGNARVALSQVKLLSTERPAVMNCLCAMNDGMRMAVTFSDPCPHLSVYESGVLLILMHYVSPLSAN